MGGEGRVGWGGRRQQSSPVLQSVVNLVLRLEYKTKLPSNQNKGKTAVVASLHSKALRQPAGHSSATTLWSLLSLSTASLNTAAWMDVRREMNGRHN